MNMRKKIFEYVLITLGIILTALGVYLFKFPNHFAFGGATGIATVVEAVTGINASDVSFIINLALLVLGCIVLGRDFGTKTIYASALFTVMLSFMERLFPIDGPLTSQPILELIYAIAPPGSRKRDSLLDGLLFRRNGYPGHDPEEVHQLEYRSGSSSHGRPDRVQRLLRLRR